MSFLPKVRFPNVRLRNVTNSLATRAAKGNYPASVHTSMSQRLRVLLLFTLLPTWAFAHGEEVLTTVFLFVGSLLLFFVVVLVIALPYAEKAVLTVVYLTTIGFVTYLTNDWSYRVNMTLINILTGLVPVLTTGAAYLLMWARRKKKQGRQTGF
jgi:hypothetical protein